MAFDHLFLRIFSDYSAVAKGFALLPWKLERFIIIAFFLSRPCDSTRQKDFLCDSLCSPCLYFQFVYMSRMCRKGSN